MIGDIIIFVLWFAIGLLNLIPKGEIRKSSYALCWACLMVWLASNILLNFL